MTCTLDHVLRIVAPYLSTDLVGVQQLSAIRQLAGHLPPVVRAAIECRLDAGNNQVDLSQSISDDREKKLLQKFISGDSYAGAGWDYVRNFIGNWIETDKSLHNKISNIWFEYDIDPATVKNAISLPGIFLSFNPDGTNTDQYRQALEIVERSFDLLLNKPVRKEVVSRLQTLADKFPDGVYVSNFGIMPARHPLAIRININNIPVDSVASFLQDISTKPVAKDLADVIEVAWKFSGHVALCLDINETVSDRIGFEMFFNNTKNTDRDIRACLDFLVAAGYCSANKRNALLDWPGCTDPATIAEPWATDLVMENLHEPPDIFNLIERTINHLKLVYQPGRPLEAKVYLAINWARMTMTKARQTRNYKRLVASS